MPQRDGGDERRGWFALTREKTGKKGKEIKLLGEREEKKNHVSGRWKLSHFITQTVNKSSRQEKTSGGGRGEEG